MQKHLVYWNVCTSIHDGVLGIKRLLVFNQGLLGIFFINLIKKGVAQVHWEYKKGKT